jgi:uncharacterized peroxidase-related enzyme
MSMRLEILNSGHSFGAKALFAVIRAMSRHPVLDIIKLVKYRPEFYGKPMAAVTHEAMRGPSAWSVGDRELMAAVVAKAIDCPFCIRAHAAVATAAYQDEAKVAGVLSDIDTAEISDALRATLRMLWKLSREGTVTAEDMRVVLDAGVSREQIQDSLAVSFAFNTTARLANAFGFDLPDAAAMDAGAKFLLARGYR